jgi:hypothetical protein
MPWTPEHALTGIDRSRPRCIDIIDVAFWAYLVDTPIAAERVKRPKWWVDCSQGVERHPWGSKIPCINQDSVPYSFELDRVLSLEDRGGRPCDRVKAFQLCSSHTLPPAVARRQVPSKPIGAGRGPFDSQNKLAVTLGPRGNTSVPAVCTFAAVPCSSHLLTLARSVFAGQKTLGRLCISGSERATWPCGPTSAFAYNSLPPKLRG